jgi:hypothetical protein
VTVDTIHALPDDAQLNVYPRVKHDPNAVADTTDASAANSIDMVFPSLSRISLNKSYGGVYFGNPSKDFKGTTRLCYIRGLSDRCEQGFKTTRGVGGYLGAWSTEWLAQYWHLSF